jgi:CheY-like chemotaxis protein
MDINMPLMDGFTATRRIIEKYKLNAPKIIACTAFTDSDTK